MRRAILLAGLLVCASPVFADPPSENVLFPDVGSATSWYIEPHAGIDYSFIDGNPAIRAPMSYAGPERSPVTGEGEPTGPTVLDIYEDASGLAPLVGVTIGVQLSPTIGLELDLAYDSRRGSASGMTRDLCEIRDTITNEPIGTVWEPANKEITIGADYLSLGLVGTFGFKQFFFYAGPSVGIPLARTVDETTSWADETTPCRYFFGTADESMELVGVLDESVETATRVSLKLGVGVHVAIGSRVELVPRVGYDLGFTDLFTGSGAYTLRAPGSAEFTPNFLGAELNNAVRVSSLQASLGVRILL
jgi:hypothetical protein